MTAVAVGSSAWLAIAVIPDSVFLTVVSLLGLLWVWMCPWPAAKTLEEQLARTRRSAWIALTVSLLALSATVAQRQGWLHWGSAGNDRAEQKEARERQSKWLLHSNSRPQRAASDAATRQAAPRDGALPGPAYRNGATAPGQESANK